jgi:hypothetical protein
MFAALEMTLVIGLPLSECQRGYFLAGLGLISA